MIVIPLFVDGDIIADLDKIGTLVVRLARPSVCVYYYKSATSRVGRLIYLSGCDLPINSRESRGLAVACR
jgi:hypothetical protein